MKASEGLDDAILGAGDDAEILSFDVPGDPRHLERIETEVKVGVERPQRCEQDGARTAEARLHGHVGRQPERDRPLRGSNSSDRESLEIRNVGLERGRGVEDGRGHRRHRLERVDRGRQDLPAVKVPRIAEEANPGSGSSDRCGHQRRLLRSPSGSLVERSDTNASVANRVVGQPGAAG